MYNIQIKCIKLKKKTNFNTSSIRSSILMAKVGDCKKSENIDTKL